MARLSKRRSRLSKLSSDILSTTKKQRIIRTLQARESRAALLNRGVQYIGEPVAPNVDNFFSSRMIFFRFVQMLLTGTERSPQVFCWSHVKAITGIGRAGIKPTAKFTVHTLRKRCGQNWADHLPMNVVKEFLGHSDISTTAEFYNTVDRQHEEKAAEVVQQLLDRNKSDVRVT